MWFVFMPLAAVAGVLQTDGVWDIFDIAFGGFALFSMLALALDTDREWRR